jgi:electron transfer flavoprotein beta subunit
VTALVTNGAHDLALMRTVASYRLDRVTGLYPPAQKRGEPDWLAEHALLAAGLKEKPVDLILIGREHGDLDDGMIPAYLAAKWKLPFLGLAQSVQAASANTWQVERAGTVADEVFTLTGPAMVSITNAKTNRLRHPLMKNVMLAKQQKFEILTPQGSSEQARAQAIAASPPATVARGAVPCEMLQGNIAAQAEMLAMRLLSTSAEKNTHAR